MAIYHLHASMVSRGKGRSVMAAAAYIAAARMHDERQDMTHDYSRKRGVEHVEILAPEHAPAWVYNRNKLWNAVDKKEVRKNSQTARELRVALPIELSDEQQLEVVRHFVRDSLVSRGMVAELAIHRDDPGNPHAHILLTTRTIAPDGFAEKDRSWDTKSALHEWRGDWAHQCNLGLARAGLDVAIDHRSFADQGIDLTPSRHLGMKVEEALQRGASMGVAAVAGALDAAIPKSGLTPPSIDLGGQSGPGPSGVKVDVSGGKTSLGQKLRRFLRGRSDAEREVRRRLENGHKILGDPGVALDGLVRSQATFTRSDIAHFLGMQMDAPRVDVALSRVCESGDLLFLGRDGQGRDRFTTKGQIELESETLRVAETMAGRHGHSVSKSAVRAPSLSRQMGREQEAAFRYLTQDSGDMAVVQGYAGAGKTYLLGAAREAWEADGLEVVGASLAAKAAQGLEAEAGIPSRTIASLLMGLDNQQVADPKTDGLLHQNSVLVVDEAGMAGTRDLCRLFRHAEEAGAKVVLVGDTEQLQAVEAGGMMRAIGAHVGEVVISEVRRQKEPWQQEASRAMGRGESLHALDAYREHGHFTSAETKAEAIDAMVSAWSESRLAHPEDSSLMLAHERSDVAALNEKARAVLVDRGVLGDGVAYSTTSGTRAFAAGDRVVFGKNDREMGVQNGQTGVVQSVREKSLVVRLDDGDQREVTIHVSRYQHFDHGYAVTVHKSQGVTVSRSFVLASRNFDSHLSYVALSRHKEDVRCFWSSDVFGSERGLLETLSRAPSESVTLDYALAHDLHDGVLRGNLGAAFDEHSVDAQRARFVAQVQEGSDAELRDWRERLVPHAGRELRKPGEMDAADERLRELSRQVDEAHERWVKASTPYFGLREAYVAAQSKTMSKQDALRQWERKGCKSKEAKAARKAMEGPFAQREKAIAKLQKLHRRSKVAQKAVAAAGEHNDEVRRSREMLHIVERELEGRHVRELQNQLDAHEFNVLQRLRLWDTAARECDRSTLERAYAREGRLKDLWGELRLDERVVSGARYEVSGVVGTRGAWFSPIEVALPEDHEAVSRGLDEAKARYGEAQIGWLDWCSGHGREEAEAAVRGEGAGASVYRELVRADRARDAAKQAQVASFEREAAARRGAYLEAGQAWGQWRAEHRIAEAHAARRGEGEGASVYRDFVVADRTHAQAQRAHFGLVVRDELACAEKSHCDAVQAWQKYQRVHPEEAAQAYKGEGEAGELWKAERETYRELTTWQREHDWLARRGRHHVFPQPRSAGTPEVLADREQVASGLLAQWESFKGSSTPEQLEQARQGMGSGGQLYEEYRVALRERQHSRRELRIENTLGRLTEVEREHAEVHGQLTHKLDNRESIQRALGERGEEGKLWRKQEDLNRTRERLVSSLDSLLGVESIQWSHPDGVLPSGPELGRQWHAAEKALCEKAAAWAQVPEDERRRACIGFSEHAELYRDYREAVVKRNALATAFAINERSRQLRLAEGRHHEALEVARTREADEQTVKAEAKADRERQRSRALLDKVLPWSAPAMHPQPNATDERAKAVEAQFEAASKEWASWSAAQSTDEVIRAHRGEPECEGATLHEAYRHADIERRHVQTEARINELEQRLSAIERDLHEVHGRLIGSMDSAEAVSRALSERDGPGELFKKHLALEAKQEKLGAELGKLMRVQRPVSELEGELTPEQRREQWWAAEKATASVGAAWYAVPDEHRRHARTGFGAYASTHEEYCRAVAQRESVRAPLLEAYRMHRVEVAERQHFDALRRLGDKKGADEEIRELERAAGLERVRAQGVLNKVIATEPPAKTASGTTAPERLRSSEVLLRSALRKWVAWMDANPRSEQARARRAEPQCEGTALLRDYRQADLERRQLQHDLRVAEKQRVAEEKEREREAQVDEPQKKLSKKITRGDGGLSL